ncbi:xylulokinase [Schaalia hyovaginalis]|uniref:xylulokinase n=1 Tax=Schaalia hyovaginalis TaxID=29316 RepID=UPI001F2D2BC3|nr:FGGY-family carbohydrate kinase [Schaalia hyovaginalis]
MTVLPVWLGLDVGTTGVRCLAVDEELRVVASSYAEAPPVHSPDGRVEQDPWEWVEASCHVIGDVVDEVGPSRVHALGISSQGISLIPVDRRGAPIRHAISWLDERGAHVMDDLAARVDPADVVTRTGKPWSGVYTLPKIMWMRRFEPENYERVAAFLQPMDWLHLCFVGEAVTDRTLASASMAASLADGLWDCDLLDALEIDIDLFPTIRRSGTEAGVLRREMAERLGVGTIPVRVGGQDQKLAAMAAGIGPDVATLCLGTSGALEVRTDAPLPWGGPLFSFLEPGQWVREAAIPTAGAAHRWFVRTMLAGESYDLSDELAAMEPAADAPLFFPRLSDPSENGWPHAPGGVMWGLGLGTNRADLARCVYEGVAFEVGDRWRRMGAEAETVRVFGGGARSEVWCRIIASVLGRPVECLHIAEASALGAAVSAGAPRTPLASREVLPDESVMAWEEERFEHWRLIAARLDGG